VRPGGSAGPESAGVVGLPESTRSCSPRVRQPGSRVSQGTARERRTEGKSGRPLGNSTPALVIVLEFMTWRRPRRREALSGRNRQGWRADLSHAAGYAAKPRRAARKNRWEPRGSRLVSEETAFTAGETDPAPSSRILGGLAQERPARQGALSGSDRQGHCPAITGRGCPQT